MAKITEKRLYAVPPQAFTANGGVSGKVTIADTRKFIVGHIVLVKSSTQPTLTLKVKRIVSTTEMYVGPEKEPIQVRTDLSAYLTADTASVEANEQNRPSVPEQEIERNTYAEEPAVARRTLLVDQLGNPIDDGNPLPVQVDTTVNIGDVRITAQDNDPNPGNLHSSVRISDGIDELAINPDGSINVVIPPGAGGIPVNEFNEIASVLAGVLTTILTYTVPAPYGGSLFRVEVGGNNVATYEVWINGTVEARVRTWFGTSLTQVCEFSSGASGFQLFTGDVIEVKVLHNRPYVGDFEARLQAQLQ
jgi:hypothetical protein